MELLKIALEAAYQAGEEILKIYRTDFSVEKKEDESPITLADMKSHEVISKMLKETDLPLISEEGRDISYETRKSWKKLWMIDPMDGTKEFVKKNGEFTVNIALIENEKPVIGVIYWPDSDIMYFAQQDLGAYKSEGFSGETSNGKIKLDQLIENSKKLPITSTNGTFTAAASRSHMSPKTQEYIDRQKEKHGDVDIIRIGSSLKFCMVAEGQANIYPKFGNIMEWDTAAGQAIVEAAGFSVVDMNTDEPITYNKKELVNPYFLVTTNNK